MSAEEIKWEDALAKPFLYEELDWVGIYYMKTDDGGFIEIAPYVTNRAVQDRLDQVVGKDRWKNKFIETAEGMLCELSILVDGEWVTKSDGAEKKGREPLKTACSVAMKRAAVHWGIGRFLYYLPRLFGEIQSTKNRNYYRYTDKSKTTIWYMPDSNAIKIVKKATGEIE